MTLSADQASGSVRGYVLFLLGLSLYLFVQVGLVLGPIAARPVPPGTTDAYVYIAKAAQLNACIRARCPALADIRRQAAAPPAEARAAAVQRSLLRVRGLYQYHPLHSVTLAALHGVGLGWELSLNLTSLGGSILISWAVAWLLLALVGPGPAGLALGLLAFAVYPGYHGLHWIVPSTISLGFGLAAWAAVVARIRGLSWILPVLILCAVWMHPMGRIHGAAALLLYVVLVARFEWRRWWVVAAGALAILSPTLVQFLSGIPALAYEPMHAPRGWSYAEGLRKNFDAAVWALRPWLLERGGIAVLAFAAMGVAFAPVAMRRRFLLLVALTAALCVASLFYVLPRYPAELFHRLFIPFAVVATGLAGYGLWNGIARILAPRGAAATSPARTFGRTVGITAGVALGLSLIAGVGFNGSRAALAQARYIAVWGVMPLDRGQPRRVLKATDAGGGIAYLDELSFYFYASRGGLARRTVYDPAVHETPAAADEYEAARRVAVAVAARNGFFGYVPLRATRPVAIRPAAAIDWSAVRLNVETRGRPIVLEARLLDGAGVPVRRITLRVAQSGWHNLGLPKNTNGRTLLVIRAGSGPLAWLQGVRLRAGQGSTWPWDEGLVIRQWKMDATLTAAAPRVADRPGKTIADHRFRTRDLVPAGCRFVALIEDFGATVASRVACGARPQR